MAEENIVEKVLRDTVGAAHAEDLFVEAVRDLVKDEVKSYIRSRLDANPDLKAEIRAAVRDLMHAKLQEAYAFAKLAKAGVKLGLELVPPDMRAEVTRELARIIEKEVSAIIEQT
ncbi:MAG TPA: hypothetical protein VJ400_02670 [Thermoplasmata archaeon]|nr:hypothetical protein [Thermoplasmata archaeon]